MLALSFVMHYFDFDVSDNLWASMPFSFLFFSFLFISFFWGKMCRCPTTKFEQWILWWTVILNSRVTYMEIWLEYSKSVTNFNPFNCLWPRLKASLEGCPVALLGRTNWTLFLVSCHKINSVMLKCVTGSAKMQVPEINIKSFFSHLLSCIVPYSPFPIAVNSAASSRANCGKQGPEGASLLAVSFGEFLHATF